MSDAAATFAAHYTAYRADLVRYLTFAAGRDEAEDMAQEVFLRAWEAASGCAPAHSFKAWLFQIGRNLVIDNYRRGPIPLIALDAIAEPVARDEYARAERWIDAAAIWQHLTDKQQASLTLSLLGYKDHEAAPMLGVETVTYRRRVMRAKHTLMRAYR